MPTVNAYDMTKIGRTTPVVSVTRSKSAVIAAASLPAGGAGLPADEALDRDDRRRGEQADHGQAATEMPVGHLALTQHVHESEDGRHREHERHRDDQVRRVPLVHVRRDHGELFADVALALGVDDHPDHEQERRADHAHARNRLAEVVRVRQA